MRRIWRTVHAMIALVATMAAAAAQDVPGNNGRWWNQSQQSSAFLLFNPLTTLYARAGYYRGFGQNSPITNLPFPLQATARIDGSDGLEIGFGFRLMPILRYELRLGGNVRADMHLGTNPYTHARVSSVLLMNNLFFDIGPLIGNPFALNPYVFGGIGLSFNRVDHGISGLQAYDHGRRSFAWNAGAGIQWQAMDFLILDIGYRYMRMGRMSENPTTLFYFDFSDRREHQVTFGIVVPFAGLARAFGN